MRALNDVVRSWCLAVLQPVSKGIQCLPQQGFVLRDQAAREAIAAHNRGVAVSQ